MKVTLLLADSAQAVGNKLYILGGGWSAVTVGAPFAVAVKVEVPWIQGSDPHTLRLDLLDIDGYPVCARSPSDDVGENAPIVVERTLETATPAGLKPGTPLDAVVAIDLGPGLPLKPGSRYEWRLSIDGRTEDGWYVAFSTRALDPSHAVAA
jgi:uncharacterized protein DUF6941